MKKINWRPGAMLAPVPPALVSCGTIENPNALTVAWTGIINTLPPKTYISLRPERFSYGIIKESGEFVINLVTVDIAKAADYCGVRSGAREDKLKKCGLSVTAGVNVSAPQIEQSPVSIECKVTDVIPLGSHHMFMADIVEVSVAENLLDENGKLRLDKAGIIAYAHGEYYALGRKVGDFGYSVRKKSTERRRRLMRKNNTPANNARKKYPVRKAKD